MSQLVEPRKTAGQISNQLAKDKTKYDALEIGHAMADDIMPHIRQCIENHKSIIDENEFCIVMLLAKDPLLASVVRRKFYAWPYLPKPRPNQAVFLYNKGLDRITKRLWVMPSDVVMAELHSLSHVDKRYQTMKAWADAFYKGWKFVRTPGAKDPGKFVNTDPFHFWNYVRKDQQVDMLSEHEYFLKHREELIEAGCQVPDASYSEAFDFSKVHVKQVVDSDEIVAD